MAEWKRDKDVVAETMVMDRRRATDY